MKKKMSAYDWIKSGGPQKAIDRYYSVNGKKIANQDGSDDILFFIIVILFLVFLFSKLRGS